MSTFSPQQQVSLIRIGTTSEMTLPAQWSAAGAAVGTAFILAGLAIAGISAWLITHHIFLFDIYLCIAAPVMMWQGLEAALPYQHRVVIESAVARVEKLAGLGRRRRTFDLNLITGLELDSVHWFSRLDRAMRAVGRPRFALNAVLADGKRLRILSGYPRSVLQALAQTLADARTLRQSASNRAPNAAPAVALLDQSAVPPELRDLDAMPETGNISHAQAEGLATYILRRHGLVRTWFTLTIFMTVLGILFLANSLILIRMLLFMMHRHRPPLVVASGAALIVLLLTITGIRKVLASFQRRTVIVISHDGMTVIAKIGARKDERSWSRAAIAGVDAGPPPMRSFAMSSSKKSRQLHIVNSYGAREPVLEGPSAEVRWLATQLRHEFNVGRGNS